MGGDIISTSKFELGDKHVGNQQFGDDIGVNSDGTKIIIGETDGLYNGLYRSGQIFVYELDETKI